jgi:hypothetical protein
VHIDTNHRAMFSWFLNLKTRNIGCRRPPWRHHASLVKDPLSLTRIKKWNDWSISRS